VVHRKRRKIKPLLAIICVLCYFDWAAKLLTEKWNYEFCMVFPPSECVIIAGSMSAKESPGTDPSETLDREVYCILGVPIDAIEMDTVLAILEKAAISGAPFLLSTPNLNFLIQSQSNSAFRESLLRSALCPPDGFLILLIARIIGIPIKRRVSGSDIFEAMKDKFDAASPLKVYLFGGMQGVAEQAARRLNDEHRGLRCVGTSYPGFGTVDEMSRDSVIEVINSSGADFVIASLGAEKGQQWLVRNHDLLQAPIRAHLGAVINFQAGTLQRAPSAVQRCGLEWLWRIKEEPYLWRRYWKDGCALARIIFTNLIPLTIYTRGARFSHRPGTLVIKTTEKSDSLTLYFTGCATKATAREAIPICKRALSDKRDIIVDLTEARTIDMRFLGLLLIFRAELERQNRRLKFANVSPRLAHLLNLSGASFLL
jgi:N-acetylglucosaminyldiphosphoundecaprenol N-acetyl-beta-D-mannosaminyltransferase